MSFEEYHQHRKKEREMNQPKEPSNWRSGVFAALMIVMAFQLGWFMRGDQIYSAMFSQGVQDAQKVRGMK